MATYSDSDYEEPKSAAEIQREIEVQRSRVENTIDQIQDRLSPGQLMDELLSYTKAGGAEFAAGLGRSAAANPLPVALLGVSLAWLIAGPNATPSLSGLFSRDGKKAKPARPARAYDASAYESYDDGYLDDRLDEFDDTLADAFDDELEYAYAPIQGSSLRRSSSGTDEASGSTYAEFVDEAGKKFRAATDAIGNRAGHFTDEAGNKFGGFTDAAGNRIRQFRDEAGDLISDAAGWAAEKWGQGRRLIHDARDAVSRGASTASGGVASGVSALSSGASSAGRTAARAGRSVSQAGLSAGRQVSSAGASAGRKVAEVGSNMSSRVADVGNTVGKQGAYAARKTADVLQDQPLVTGALAFAVGAAIGALLPRTDKENELLGETADSVKAEAGRRAGELYSQGKEQVASLYSEATSRASEVYHQATEKAGEAYDRTRSAVADQAQNLTGAASAAASEVASAARPDTNDAEVERDEVSYGDERNQGRGI